MKYLLYIFISIIALSCSNIKKTTTAMYKNTPYLIKEIDKKNSWYIIYAERRDTTYKIVSKVDNSIKENCKTIIAVGKRYNFKLKSNKQNAPILNGIKLDPVGYTGCYQFDAETTICLEPKQGIYDLFHTDDLKGICYLNKMASVR